MISYEYLMKKHINKLRLNKPVCINKGISSSTMISRQQRMHQPQQQSNSSQSLQTHCDPSSSPWLNCSLRNILTKKVFYVNHSINVFSKPLECETFIIPRLSHRLIRLKTLVLNIRIKPQKSIGTRTNVNRVSSLNI